MWLAFQSEVISMSMFGLYFVRSLIHEAGWPRKQGLLRAEVFDTLIADQAVEQMIDWAAALGAGRPRSALEALGEMFRDRDWTKEGAPNIAMFIAEAQKSWRQDTSVPHEIIKPAFQLAKTFGKSISVKDFMDKRLSMAFEQHVLEALLWGLSNPRRFEQWYTASANKMLADLRKMQAAGLAVEEMPSFAEFLQQSEEILRAYETTVGGFAPVPSKLLSDALALGVDIQG